MGFFTCLTCGVKIHSDDYYCPGCGKVINGEVSLPSKKLTTVIFLLIVALSFAGFLAISTMLTGHEDGREWGQRLFIDSNKSHSVND